MPDSVDSIIHESGPDEINNTLVEKEEEEEGDALSISEQIAALLVVSQQLGRQTVRNDNLLRAFLTHASRTSISKSNLEKSPKSRPYHKIILLLIRNG